MTASGEYKFWNWRLLLYNNLHDIGLQCDLIFHTQNSTQQKSHLQLDSDIPFLTGSNPEIKIK